jgi:hypothetical protein
LGFERSRNVTQQLFSINMEIPLVTAQFVSFCSLYPQSFTAFNYNA